MARRYQLPRTDLNLDPKFTVTPRNSEAALVDLAVTRERVIGLSRYARQLLARDPGLLEAAALAAPWTAEHMRAVLEADPPADEPALACALRRLRARVLLNTLSRDLCGLAPVEEVTATMTALAETTIAFALERLDGWLAAVHGEARSGAGQRQRLIVVGMGKLGGGELNASSDVDLVFVYPEDATTGGPRPLSCHEYFTRLGRKLIAALSERTEDGFVFRVDMRLRPYGDSGPLVMSLDMLEEYFSAQGRPWERYAWVKGRALSGEHEAELMAIVTPFVYRRHLDFSAIQSMRELHDQIRKEVKRRDMAENIKLGPGGIREIEFTAQVFQLIRGGRDPALRLRPTLAALNEIARRGWLPDGVLPKLEAAYRFLRNLEHRLQYLDDQQTQTLPTAEDDRARVATGMGFDSYRALLEQLAVHRDAVAMQFEALFSESRTAGDGDALETVAVAAPEDPVVDDALAALGYVDPRAACERIRTLRGSVRFRRMSASGQARVDRLLPRLLRAAATFPPADTTFERLLNILESIGRRESYLALLIEYPQALESVARLASLSPWASDYLARQPMLLDELLDPNQLAEPDRPALAAGLARDLAESQGNTEHQMDLLRHFKHIQTFRLLALDLAGALTLERLSDHLSDLATLVLEHVVAIAWQQVRTRHREVPLFAVIGYGKFGGRELGYASDLDLIFLHRDEAAEAPENYARLAQRINTWLTSYTGAGTLYETDLRLRPDGASGLLVSRFDAFERYQREQAWVWEHQALTRARFVTGEEAIGRAFESLRIDVLRLPRDPEALRIEVVAMRARMQEGHPNATPQFDLKHDAGGIVDVEFCVQFLVLAHAHSHAELAGNIGNIALLRLAGQLGLVDAELAVQAGDAYREYRRAQHALRLRGETFARVDPAEFAAERECVLRLRGLVLGE
ncbi:MAG: bifunctional [glutamate--ammonia ligase]-adenylyl-L-tyrosine phosphorylase/[glutamate--ammonia-ligase] adenylyltransferase [Betaproteobacteria bacterium]